MKTKGKFIKDFALRGLIAMGFGPLVLAIVYSILGLFGVVESIGVYEMPLGIVTITALAFLCGGITVVYQIESLAISKAITLHGVVLYIAYAVVYLTNDWLEEGMIPFLIFTAIFVVGFALVWVAIYLITNNHAKKLNSKLKNRAE